MTKLLIASDHAGFDLKEQLKTNASRLDVTFEDLGTKNAESVDYPDYANLLAQKLSKLNEGKPTEDQALGILICGSGVGVSIAANRYPDIRAVLAESVEVAKLGREHNHANVLCLGARMVGLELGLQIVDGFLKATPDTGDRHVRRVQKLKGAKS
jgi:ribose 5-phosphate isomerase B